MLRAVSWTLHQRRYAALAAFMALLAIGCAAAGTFEIHRYHEKRHDNGVLTANVRARSVALTTSIVPFVGHGRGPEVLAVRYRTVTVTGRYSGVQQYVGNVQQGGRQGFYVLSPLVTSTGTLLVARGFVAATADGSRPARVVQAPAGAVTVTGRLEDAQGSDDQLGRLGHDEINSINPAEQARRLGTPVFQAYLSLGAGQAGTSGLSALPGPPSHNPSGGASEWQLMSYVVQWYAFALLAIIAPFLFSRAEAREARKRYLGIDTGTAQFDDVLEEAPGAPALEGVAATSASTSASDGLAVRSGGEVAARDDGARWQRALRLADRYGVSLGDVSSAAADRRAVNHRSVPVADVTVRDSSAAAHRSQDAYHGAYNDYLWQLALADGDLPELAGLDDVPGHQPRPGAGPLERPRTVELDAPRSDEPE